jgi:predicted SnoaL-like aldol condensation-catalyzing enzyme
MIAPDRHEACGSTRAALAKRSETQVSNLHPFALSVEKIMPTTTEEKNKALVLEAFDTLFNKRDFAAARRFWAAEYIQHSAHIPPGREGLFELVRNAPPEMRYQNGTIMAEGNLLMLHGRFSGIGAPANWIVLDIVRLEEGLLKEHWDVIEDEATRASSRSGRPMFGGTFPGEAPAR